MFHLIERYVPSASTYSGDIDFVFSLIFWIVGFWFLATELVFFWLILRFRKRDGVKAQYITGELESEKRWIHWPHMAVLVFDVFILVAAVKVWYDVKQDLPPAQETVRVIAQQWAWSFVHPGPDGQLDTADDIKTVDELHVEGGHALPLQARVTRRAAQLLGAGLPAQAGRDPRPRDHGLVRGHQDRHVRHPVRGDLRHRPRADARRAS